MILHMLRIGATQRWVDPLAAGIDVSRSCEDPRRHLQDEDTDLHRILTHYLPLYLPAIAHFAGKSRSDWLLALIERSRHPSTNRFLLRRHQALRRCARHFGC